MSKESLAKHFSIRMLKSLVAGALTGFFLAIAMYGIVLQLPLRTVKETIALATTIRPETYTELYFENHTSLLRNLSATDSASFTFAIPNKEFKDMEYPYVVSLERNTGSFVIDQGVMKLKQDQVKTHDSFVQINPGERAKVTVRLLNLNQQIHFWIGARP